MSIHALTERAMILNLSISLWQGYRLDKEASRKVTEDAGADKDAARVNKHLVPKEALAPVVTAAGAIRTHFYEKTLPWRDNGDRLMTRILYMPFIERHEQLVSEFNAAVDRFLTVDYPKAREQAAFRMGELFNPDDYPGITDLRYRFRAVMEISPISTANDFRVQIDADHVDRVRADIEAQAEKRVHSAMADVWRRMAETVGYFADRLGDPKAVFRDSTVRNVAELVDLIPGLNLLDDPNIEQLRVEIKSKLTGIDPKDIRKDGAFREELSGQAKEIVDKMQGFIRAFGGGTN